jgi:tripartite-type tricarboxylate transporter receptor subunit TctC
MKMIRSLLLAAAIAATASAHAQTYPAKPVTMIIPFPAGGRTDVIGRIFAQRRWVNRSP